jgi:hypothetical protein
MKYILLYCGMMLGFLILAVCGLRYQCGVRPLD